MLTPVYFQGCASCEPYFYQVILSVSLIHTHFIGLLIITIDSIDHQHLTFKLHDKQF